MKIMMLKKTVCYYISDVFVHRHMGLESNTKIFFKSSGEIILGSSLMLFRLLQCFWIKKFALFELIDKILFRKILSIIHDSIIEKEKLVQEYNKYI